MKKLTAIIITLIIILLPVSGCGVRKNSDDRLKVVCTIFPQYDFVRNIAGDLVDLKMLVPFGMESHDFTLENMSVADVAMVGAADLFIYVGGESDSQWVDKLKNTVAGETEWLAIIDTVDTVNESLSDSMLRAHEHDGDAEADEHVWASPKKAIEISDAITNELCYLDPHNAETYKENFADYKGKLQELDKRLYNVTRGSVNKTLIFADRFPFRYLAADYGLSYDAAFPGCSSATDPSVAQITSLCESAVATGAKAIFYMENSNPQYARQIAERVGAKTYLLHSCHTVTKAQYEAGASYISLMEGNINSISEAFYESDNG